MPRLFRSHGFGYVVAAGATAAAFLVRLGLDPWIGGASPLLTFTLAVMAAAVAGGLFPGLLATALSAAAGSYFLGRDGVPGGEGEAVQLVVFSLVGGGVSYLCERMHAARRRAEGEVERRRRAEAALQGQKDLLQTTLTSVGDGMIATDAEARVTFLNPVAEALTGWTRGEAEGVPLTTVFRIVNEETRAEVENPALRALKDGVVVGLANHTVLLSKDGSERPIDDSAAPIRGDDGTLHGAVLVFRDVTEAKAAERTLRESERRYRTTLESITDAFFAFDADWRFTYVNREAERLLGLSRDDLLGRSHWDVYPDTLGTVVERSYRRAAAENVAVTFENYYAPHDRWYEVHAYPSPEGLAVYFRDASGRKRAERELLRSRDELEARVAERTAELDRQKRFLEALLENVEDGIVACDGEGRLTLFNRATREFHGLPPEPVPSEAWAERYDLFRPDGVTPMPPEEVPLLRALRGERVENAEMVIAPKGGKDRVLLASGRAFHDGGGRLLGAVVSMHDVTERKRAEEALRAAHAELEARVAERTADLSATNAALLRSEARKSAILDSALDAVITIDHEGRVVDFNPAAERTFGYSRADVLGREMAEFVIPPAFRDAHRDGIARYLATGEGPVLNRRVELTAVRSDGAEFPVEAAITPIPGDPPLFTGHLRDIAERKRQEEALLASESRFRTLAEAVPQIVWVTRPDGWHEFYNARWYEYTGLTPEQSLGHGWAVPLHPDDRARSEARWKLATDTGEPYEIEYRFRSKDGAYRWFLGRAMPARDEAGGVTRWFGTCTDIDDAKRAEMKAAFLADASAHLSEVLDYRSTMQKVALAAVPAFADWIAVDLAAEDGSLQRVATTHADRAKERLARELAEKYPPRPGDPHGPARVFRTGDPELVPAVDESLPETLARDAEHLRLLRSLGFRSYMSVPLVTKGRATGVMTFVTADSGRRYDASDLAVAEDLARRVAVAVENVGLYEALKEADQRKDEFLATLAHELRNPLAPIRMGLEVLRLGGDDPETVSEMLGTMDRQVGQMVRLIDDLLDVSRITRGKLDLRKTRVDLRDVAKAAVETVRPMMAEARHELTVSMPAEPLILDGDPARLSQVFSNLLNNAAKYTPEGGRVGFTAERQGSDVVVSVTDTGLGIPEGMLERVFEMFAQIDRTLERSHGGLGIGLHLVKRLVELHGGRVEARSEGEGRGSEFVVRLPLVVSPVGPTAEGPAAGGANAGRRVLVADDNRDAADLLARVLKALGHEVRVAYDGQAAVEAAESYRPDVCLLDIGMPKLSGYDACRAIRAEPWGETTFLVALTGWGAEEDRRRSKEAGFDRHLVKPVEPAVLRELLAETHRAAN